MRSAMIIGETTGRGAEGLADLGLWGDGDEIDAVTDVEAAFGVKLDYTHASEWLTTGDVFEALLKALPPGQGDRDEVWTRFAEAISQQTDVDPAKILPSTLLLIPKSQTLYAQLLWAGIAVAGVAGIVGVWNLLT